MEKVVKDFITELGFSINNLDIQENKVNSWLTWYKGKTKYHEYYVYNGKVKNKFTMKTLNMASQVCEDLSDFFFNEKLDITIDKVKVQDTIKEILESNNFIDSSNRLMQLVKALGTGAYVPYLDNGVLRINYLDATNIVILESNKNTVKSVLFWSKEKVLSGEQITINAHILTEKGYDIYNRKYIKKTDTDEYIKVDIGNLELIETKSFLPRFAMIMTPQVNNQDINSPYGVSCYANATDNILSTDRVFDSLDNEIVLGKKRVYIKAGAAKFNIDEQGNPTAIFDTSEVVYYLLPNDGTDKMITESSFDLRIEDITAALQAQLNLLSSKVGLGANYYKFKDGQVYVNTDNVMSSNSDVFRKIKKQENIITKAINDLIYAIAELLGLKGKFSISVFYDDSIIEDTEKIRLQALTEYNAKLISKAQYYRDVYKLKDKEAIAFAEQMNEEILKQTITDGSEFNIPE